MAVGNTKVVQVTNIAPQATKDQMQTLFGYLGKIEDIRLYPTIRDVSCPVQSRICYIKFVDTSTVGIAQHMTNTVFIDRALIVIPVQSGEIPDEYYALEMTRNGALVPGINVNEPKLPSHVVNAVQGIGNEQVIVTADPQLEASGLPLYPPLLITYDSTKIEETRRTIIVQNIDESATGAEVIDFFSAAGEVKYLRSATHSGDNLPLHLIEFSDQPSVLQALRMDNTEFKGQIIQIQHATQAIVKPQAKSNEAAQKEIEEAMSRFKEAQSMINASIEPVIGMLTKDKRSSRRSRSRSRGRRHRSRSRSRSRRSHSRRRRSTSRSRRSRSRDRKRRSKSRSRRRSRSVPRRSHSRGSKSRRSRSKSSSKKLKSKERDSRARSRDKDRKSRDQSRDRKRSRDVKSKDRERSKEKSRESKEKKSDKQSSSEVVSEKNDKRRSRSHSRYRSRSRDRRRDRKRSRSRTTKRRSPSPKRKLSRSKSRERKRGDKRDRRDKDRKERSRSRSRSKIPRNYDEEEKGFEGTDKEKLMMVETETQMDKESSEKSDNMDISNSP